MLVKQFRLFDFAVLTVCACVNLAFVFWALITRPALNTDFRGPWSFGRFARHQAAQLYQPAPLQEFQHLLYPGFKSFFPYQYPPDFLLPIWWLSDCSFALGLTIWTLAGVIALILAAGMFFKPSCRGFAILALLASPAALLNGAAGETGFFTTAILLAGFALLRSRPWSAGIVFGLLTLKPQLAILLPVALLARGDMAALAAAGLTALALIALSCLFWPPELWLDWLRCLPHYQAAYLAGGIPNANTAVTVAANLVGLGFGNRFAWNMQMAAAVAAAALVFLAFRRALYRLAVAALCSGMFICTPHAFAYDTLPLTAAMLLLAPESPPAIGFCSAIYLAPYLLLSTSSFWFFYAVPETLLFAGIIYLAIARGQRPNTQDEPVPARESHPFRF